MFIDSLDYFQTNITTYNTDLTKHPSFGKSWKKKHPTHKEKHSTNSLKQIRTSVYESRILIRYVLFFKSSKWVISSVLPPPPEPSHRPSDNIIESACELLQRPPTHPLRVGICGCVQTKHPPINCNQLGLG